MKKNREFLNQNGLIIILILLIIMFFRSCNQVNLSKKINKQFDELINLNYKSDPMLIKLLSDKEDEIKLLKENIKSLEEKNDDLLKYNISLKESLDNIYKNQANIDKKINELLKKNE